MAWIRFLTSAGYLLFFYSLLTFSVSYIQETKGPGTKGAWTHLTGSLAPCILHDGKQKQTFTRQNTHIKRLQKHVYKAKYTFKNIYAVFSSQEITKKRRCSTKGNSMWTKNVVTREDYTENRKEVKAFLKEIIDAHWSVVFIISLFLFKMLGIRYFKLCKP